MECMTQESPVDRESSRVVKVRDCTHISALYNKLKFLSFKKVTDHSVFEQTLLHCNQLEAIGLIACIFPESAIKLMGNITKVFVSGEITLEALLVLKKLPNLKSLQIEGGNTDAGIIENLCSSLPHLEEISFYMTRNLKEENIQLLADMFTQLKRLTFFHSNGFFGSGLSSFNAHQTLTSISVWMGYTEMSGINDWIKNIAQLDSLHEVRLSGCEELEIDTLKSLYPLNLESLTLATNEEELIITDVSPLSGFKQLKDLRLIDFYEAETGLEVITEFERLESLSLHQCYQFSDDDLHCITKLKNLIHIDLSGMSITDDLLQQILTHSPKIESLNISQCSKITDASIKSISELNHLKKLTLQQLRFQGGFHQLIGMKSLEILDLSSNDLMDDEIFTLNDITSIQKLSQLKCLDIDLLSIPVAIDLKKFVEDLSGALSHMSFTQTQENGRVIQQVIDRRLSNMSESREYEL